jgi:hypothetical protein
MVDKGALVRGFSEYFGFTLSVSLHQRSLLTFIYTLLLLEGQMGEALKFPKTSALSEIGEQWIRKKFHSFYCLTFCKSG